MSTANNIIYYRWLFCTLTPKLAPYASQLGGGTLSGAPDSVNNNVQKIQYILALLRRIGEVSHHVRTSKPLTRGYVLSTAHPAPWMFIVSLLSTALNLRNDFITLDLTWKRRKVLQGLPLKRRSVSTSAHYQAFHRKKTGRAGVRGDEEN